MLGRHRRRRSPDHGDRLEVGQHDLTVVVLPNVLCGRSTLPARPAGRADRPDPARTATTFERPILSRMRAALTTPFLVSIYCWCALELGLVVRDLVQGRARLEHDRGTRAIVALSLAGSIFVGIAVRTWVPALDTPVPDVFAVAGLVVVWIGLAVRIWAVVDAREVVQYVRPGRCRPKCRHPRPVPLGAASVLHRAAAHRARIRARVRVTGCLWRSAQLYRCWGCCRESRSKSRSWPGCSASRTAATEENPPPGAGCVVGLFQPRRHEMSTGQMFVVGGGPSGG